MQSIPEIVTVNEGYRPRSQSESQHSRNYRKDSEIAKCGGAAPVNKSGAFTSLVRASRLLKLAVWVRSEGDLYTVLYKVQAHNAANYKSKLV